MFYIAHIRNQVRPNHYIKLIILKKLLGNARWMWVGIIMLTYLQLLVVLKKRDYTKSLILFHIKLHIQVAFDDYKGCLCICTDSTPHYQTSYPYRIVWSMFALLNHCPPACHICHCSYEKCHIVLHRSDYQHAITCI